MMNYSLNTCPGSVKVKHVFCKLSLCVSVILCSHLDCNRCIIVMFAFPINTVYNETTIEAFLGKHWV